MLVDVQMKEIRFLGMSEDKPLYGLLLRERNGARRCLMMFDRDSARFISAAQAQPRQYGKPLAHGAVLDLLAIAGLQLHHLVIPGTEEDHFRTILHFQHGSRNIERELMPSDAVALAVHADCPVLMDDGLLNHMDPIATRVLGEFDAREPSEPDDITKRLLGSDADDLPQA